MDAYSKSQDCNFQVASDARGRGVLRLLLLQQQVNLLGVPCICLQLVALAFPSAKRSLPLCFAFEIMAYLLTMHFNISSLAIALGRC